MVQSEVSLNVPDYFDLLSQELLRSLYKMTTHKNALLPQLDQRTGEAIEKKHQNISSILADMGLPYIAGYKPLSNRQQLPEDEVIDYLQAHQSDLEPLFHTFASKAWSPTECSPPDFATSLDEAPMPAKKEKKRHRKFQPIKINYLEKEQNNRALGAAGEQYIIDYEKWRLINEGRPDLVPLIEWTAKEKGDGAGYDILSKNVDGSDRYIEVKTTKLSKETSIYLTYAEIEFATSYALHFYLYRVFNFADNDKRKFFIRQGIYVDFYQLQPVSYKGIF